VYILSGELLSSVVVDKASIVAAMSCSNIVIAAMSCSNMVIAAMSCSNMVIAAMSCSNMVIAAMSCSNIVIAAMSCSNIVCSRRIPLPLPESCNIRRIAAVRSASIVALSGGGLPGRRDSREEGAVGAPLKLESGAVGSVDEGGEGAPDAAALHGCSGMDSDEAQAIAMVEVDEGAGSQTRHARRRRRLLQLLLLLLLLAGHGDEAPSSSCFCFCFLPTAQQQQTSPLVHALKP
jgi:hypothetical protein